MVLLFFYVKIKELSDHKKGEKMDIILAKTYGIYLFVVGLGLVFDPIRFRIWYKAILQEDRRQLFGGLFSLLIGALIISVHNVWGLKWQVILNANWVLGSFSGAGCLLSKNL